MSQKSMYNTIYFVKVLEKINKLSGALHRIVKAKAEKSIDAIKI